MWSGIMGIGGGLLGPADEMLVVASVVKRIGRVL